MLRENSTEILDRNPNFFFGKMTIRPSHCRHNS
jgi:hypothetical protein